MYSDTQLFIAGEWVEGAANRRLGVINPATEETIGTVACAEVADLEMAVAAADDGFKKWSGMSAFDRSEIMLQAARLLKERAGDIGQSLTLEQGKIQAEAKFEPMRAAGELEWAAGEARRAYGRVIPARNPNATVLTTRNALGPVALFSPWNFPLNQLARKLAPALAAGCSVVAKAPEETPASPAALVQALHDAGLPPGVVNLVFGEPANISDYLIKHPSIRKISFTGSVAVGKQLSALAGAHMKRSTMELGGHAPVIVCKDADVDLAVEQMARIKPFNCGQTCAAPNRLIIHEDLYDRFVTAFSSRFAKIRVGDGMSEDTQMGPLANIRRLKMMESFCADALRKGAKLTTGGQRIGNKGYYFQPTVVEEAPEDAMVRQIEAFGPLIVATRFRELDEAIAEANRLPYALACYAYTRSIATAKRLATSVECGNLIANDVVLALPEMPFGGMKESGYGMEGGTEGIDAYLATRLLSFA
ncbi:NAD-dependent succinate-semialdehyde dehydrogenase [Chelatococcus asaccharovorans]|uniref:NAD-dependent succinate-semialdehyde dehydrogenase n=1 Tax=Chelatococcus asaccharovorans TaxID=28210 RepID=UPI00224C7710|nr:NAD-dependent succinate-semialdehyde dehydrogenase [Chelatococcus asaccharovorans]CAH1649617.1 Alpha-ketoglutaric semialdehyde dehydrogenase 1 [Chelatococcus asaccharovorans]CAH1691702.1 Alpha-ketoglutaric semialdehyde dehydrogenase 1 [Chelatococcus asaccharovorans]